MSIFLPSGGRGNFKTLFVSDGHVVLDILPICSNYGDSGASQQVSLRVIAGIGIAECGWGRSTLDAAATSAPPLLHLDYITQNSN